MGTKCIRTFWSEEEIKILTENFLTQSNAELSVLLNKSKKNVGRTLKYLGLKRDEKSKKIILSLGNKKRGTDLSFTYVEMIAKKHISRGEFYRKDVIAYNKALKEGWLDEICKHMVSKRFSIPQLIMNDILEHILDEKSSYNDKKIIRPLEIDCYFSKWNIGWEYDGKYFHNKDKDKHKDEVCERKKIKLFRINENQSIFRDYVKNIKEQLINQLNTINKITGKNITKDDILLYDVNIKYPNVLTEQEKKILFGKKLSEIKKIDVTLYKRVLKYDLFYEDNLNIINDKKRYKIFKTFDEYKKHLLSCSYKSFNEMCKYEHPYRVGKKLNINIEDIRKIYGNN
jgi:hypothetical protein